MRRYTQLLAAIYTGYLGLMSVLCVLGAIPAFNGDFAVTTLLVCLVGAGAMLVLSKQPWKDSTIYFAQAAVLCAVSCAIYICFGYLHADISGFAATIGVSFASCGLATGVVRLDVLAEEEEINQVLEEHRKERGVGSDNRRA